MGMSPYAGVFASMGQGQPQQQDAQAAPAAPAMPAAAAPSQSSQILDQILQQAMNTQVPEGPYTDGMQVPRGPMAPPVWAPMHGAHNILGNIGQAMQLFGNASLPGNQYEQLQRTQLGYDEMRQKAAQLAQATRRGDQQYKAEALRTAMQEKLAQARFEEQNKLEENKMTRQTAEDKAREQRMMTHDKAIEQMRETHDTAMASRAEAAATQKEKNAALKIYAPVLDSRQRYQIMQDAQKRANAPGGDQQADVNMVANHIGMTLGLQRGARITRAIWEEAMGSAPILQRLQARFDKDGYLSGVVLTPQQRQQMLDLASVRYRSDIEKARISADMTGVRQHEPPEVGNDWGRLDRATSSTSTAQSSGMPQFGDTKQYGGFNYIFDGKEYVKQPTARTSQPGAGIPTSSPEFGGQMP